MKHIKEAQLEIDSGNGISALKILDNLLSLAPKNPEALRLKAKILDSWGRFDDAYKVMHHLVQADALEEEGFKDLEQCLIEDRETLVFSELTHEGRWYFAFPRAVIAISAFGFLGCASFLLLSPKWLSEGQGAVWELITSFFLFVAMPWIALFTIHCTGIKRILIGVSGIKVCHRFKEQLYPWKELTAAVVEYHSDIRKNHLRLKLYSKDRGSEPVLNLDISRRGSVVRARRHFLRNILSHLDVVCYLPAGVTSETLKEVISPSRPQESSKDVA